MYKIVFSKKAIEDLIALKKSEPKVYKKVKILIHKISEDPRKGRGKPSLKNYDLAGLYSRKITKKHRLVYSIDDGILVVQILAAKGHYSDK